MSIVKKTLINMGVYGLTKQGEQKQEWKTNGKLGQYLQYVRKMVETLYTYKGFSQINVLKNWKMGRALNGQAKKDKIPN